VTLFEYLAIAYSLILSFAVICLVGGLSQVFDAGRRYWIHATYVCLTLFAVLSLFWAHWSTRDLDWTFPAFRALTSSQCEFASSAAFVRTQGSPSSTRPS
jgi:hypothetical protein